MTGQTVTVFYQDPVSKQAFFPYADAFLLWARSTGREKQQHKILIKQTNILKLQGVQGYTQLLKKKINSKTDLLQH